MSKLEKIINILDNEKMLLFLGKNIDLEMEVERQVFLFTHSLNRTGAPCALLDMAQVLVDNDYLVYIVSGSDGELREDIVENKINLIIYPYFDEDEIFLANVVKFSDFILVNTLLLAFLVQSFAPVAPRLYWWLHEVEDTFQTMENSYKNVPDVPSLTLLAASPQIRSSVANYMGRGSKVLNCYVRDIKKNAEVSRSSKIRFLQIGLIIGIKGQQVFADAISSLPREISNMCEFVFCGDFSTANEELLRQLVLLSKEKDNVKVINSMPRMELFKLYDTVDVIVVPSYQESTSLIAVEGLMKEKICICSDGCGICDYLTDGKDSFIFEAGNAEALSQKIQYVAENFESLAPLKENGRLVYEKTYTRQIFEQSLLTILDDDTIINKNMNACCGCGVCETVCPSGAIHMQPNKKGFLYPEVDVDICIHCGKCRSLCPVGYDFQRNTPEFHAVKLSDVEKRMASQSGGAFTAFSEVILADEGGVVYGVGLDSDLKAKYIRVDRIEDLYRLKGSKYVQAEVSGILKPVREDLKQGRLVFVGGTACHIAGLMRYLSDCDTSKLITLDLICHGVPSPMVYSDYLRYISSENGGKITSFNFRNKAAGWHSHVESYVVDGDPEEHFSRDYAQLFYTDCAMRESCYSCRYANINRTTDITTGDYWGVEEEHPEIDDNKGVSIVSLNTPKAVKLFKKVRPFIEEKKLSPSECVIQPTMTRPIERPSETNVFWKEYQEKDLKYILRKYAYSHYGAHMKKELLNKWKQKLEDKSGLAPYFTARGIKNILMCGETNNMRIAASELIRNNICVLGILTFDEEPENIEGIANINIDQLDEYQEYDAVLVMDIVDCCDTMKKLKTGGVPLEKVVPLSFAVSAEV